MPGQQPEDQIPTVAPQVEPNAELTANVPLSTPISGAIEESASIQQRMAYWKAHATAVDAQTQFQALDNEKLYDPKGGLLSQNLGKDAGPAVEQTMADYKAKQSEIAAQLPSAMAKAQFMRSSNEHLNMVQRQGFVYERNQYNKWDGENVTASVKMSQEAALNTYDLPADPAQGDPLQHQVDKQVALIKDYGERSGQPQAQIDLNIANAKSATYAAVAEDAINTGKLDYAKQLMDTHGQEIEHSQRRILQGAAKNVEVDATTNELFGEFTQPDDKGNPATRSTYFDTLEEARKNDPRFEGAEGLRLYNKVAEQGERYFSVKDQQTMAQQKGIMDDGVKAMNQGIKLQDAVPATKFQQLTGDQQDQLMRRQDQIIKLTMPQDGSPAYYLARERMAADPDGGSTQDFSPIRSSMSEADYNRLEMAKVEAIARKTSDATKSPRNTPDAIRERVSSEILSEQGINPKIDYQNKENTQRVVSYKNILDREIEAQEQKEKRPLTYGEVTELGKQVALQSAYRDATGATSQKALFDVPGATDFAFSTTQIPDADRTTIAAGLAKRGVSFQTQAQRDEAMINIYNRSKTMKAQKAKAATPTKPKGEEPQPGDSPYDANNPAPAGG